MGHNTCKSLGAVICVVRQQVVCTINIMYAYIFLYTTKTWVQTIDSQHRAVKTTRSGQFVCLFVCILNTTFSVGRLTTQGAIAPWVLSHHIVDFLGSRRMETVPTSIEVLLHPTLGQSDEPSDLRGSLSPTIQHRCMLMS